MATEPDLPQPQGQASVDYRLAVRTPSNVCDDWVYRGVGALPGHPLAWALAVASASIPVTSCLLENSTPVDHVRSLPELSGPYLFSWSLVFVFLFLPPFYASLLRFFDDLTGSSSAPAERIAAWRRQLVEPSQQLQVLLTLGALVVPLVVQEASSQRLSRFFTRPDAWNAFDVWSLAANTIALGAVVYLHGILVTRVYLLGTSTRRFVQPELFQPGFEKSVAWFGVRASVIYSIPVMMGFSLLLALVQSTSTIFFWLPLPFTILCATAFVLFPASELQKRTETMKKQELDRVDGALSRRVDVPPDQRDLEEILRLVAYRREVRDIKEWPIDAGSFRAYAYYLLIPPITWLANVVSKYFAELMLEDVIAK